MKFTTSDAARAVNGRIHGPESAFDGATQDSRAVLPGQLFVPLVAERDGHDFIANAVDAGATAYLTQHDPDGELEVGAGPSTAIVVDDTMTALRDLAAAARARIDGPVVAITGSVGKTSAKDLLVSVLSRTRRTHGSEKSFNNEIGVPLTLVNSPDQVEAAVVEMGARGLGHIASLCEVATPTIGIVTTVAAAHTSEFGSVEAIAQAKGEIIEALPATGLAVLNADNDLVAGMAPRTAAQILTFGTTSNADVTVRTTTVDADLRATFTIDTPWGQVLARPSTRGAHMAGNVAAAVATALSLDVPIADVEAGLAEAPLSPWRMDVQQSASGALVINDSYNANPTSMLGALDSLAHLDHPRKVAILGYMGELGSTEAADHRRVADRVLEIGAELIAVGTSLYGQDPIDNLADAVDAVGPHGADTAMLIKGSRSVGLEEVARAILDT